MDAVIVEADRTKNKFGDTITEQSYYRTGGDVKVITREEIDKRHYTDITEAIKRIPGITFQNPGWRGGEYGFGTTYNNGISINGDTRVVILVDGRRVDNAASTRLASSNSRGSKGTGVILDEVTNMENVEKIEVIKGPGASVYGSDATGGVINIITRKGGTKNVGSIDVSTGSWDRHNYAVNFSGSAGDDSSFHYFISANRAMSGNSKYKDGQLDRVGTLPNSSYKEDGVNFRIDKDFNDTHNLKIWYNFKEGRDNYPVAAPSLKYWNEKDWYRILFNYIVGTLGPNNEVVEKAPSSMGDDVLPGYHNFYATRALYGMTNNFKNNDWDITYTFGKDNGMESFVRFYDQNHRYWQKGKMAFSPLSRNDAYNDYVTKFPNGATDEQLAQWMKDNLAPFPDGDPNLIKNWISHVGDPNKISGWHDEKNRGMEIQYAKSIGKHDIISGFTFDKAKNFTKKVENDGSISSSNLSRKTYFAYVQDKIHVNDKWDLTPSVRYAKYSSFEVTNNPKTPQGKGNVDAFTYALNTEYMFDDTASMYLGWTKILRPLRVGDYSTVDGVYNTPLKDEKGNAWTIGFRKELSDKTTVAVHYDWTKMSNSVATFPIWSDKKQDFVSTAVNAKEDKKSFNITVDHQFNDHLTLSASYAHMKDIWKTKSDWNLDPNWGYSDIDDINTAINNLRPQNYYSLNLSYENGKLYTGLLTNWYTGNNPRAFTSKKFLIMDWNLNYQVTKDLTAYILVNNLTNAAYETIYYSHNGIGASAMPARCILVGAKYTF